MGNWGRREDRYLPRQRSIEELVSVPTGNYYSPYQLLRAVLIKENICGTVIFAVIQI